MVASELRIGNLILSRGQVSEVEKIERDGILAQLKHTDEELDYNRGLEPILLTEEWLVRLGFKKRKNPNNPNKSVFYDDGEVLLILSDKLYCSDIVQSIEIKYVHQLQNLYFALTGEELQYGTRDSNNRK